jgi:hypothetical protein
VVGTSWTYAAAVANGTTYLFNVKETDAAGNTSAATSNFQVIGDTALPTASVAVATIKNSANAVVQSTEVGTAYLVDGTVVVTTLTEITGAADNRYNSASIAAANTNTNLAATGLVDGTYKVYTVDAAGNLSLASTNSVTVDTTPPERPVIADDQDANNDNAVLTNDNMPMLVITAATGSTVGVSMNGLYVGAATEVTTGIFNFTSLPLNNGVQNFTATATDHAYPVKDGRQLDLFI